MSAFIVSKKTMDLACMAIDNHYRDRRCDCFSTVRLDYGLDQLGRLLYGMNLDAVLQRYPNDTKDSAPGPCDISSIHENYRYTFRTDYNRYAGLKALKCLRYQCSEGNVVDAEEYRELCRVIEYIMDEIISEIPQYRAAEWDAA